MSLRKKLSPPNAEENSKQTTVLCINSILGHLISIDRFDYSNAVKLGEGGYGQVYHVDLHHQYLRQLTNQGKPVEWVIKKSENLFPEEAKIQSRFYATVKPIKGKDGFYYTLSEFIPGKDLDSIKINEFSTRMTALCQLAEQVSDYHHYTGRGAPFIHGDLKTANMRVDIDPVTHQINTYIYDFGLSSIQKTDCSEQLFKFKVTDPDSLNRSYFPNEVLAGKYGFKTDVCMFGKVMYELLKTLPTYLTPAKKATEVFIGRMRSKDYSKRSTSDEVLSYCLTLNRLHLLLKNQIDDTNLIIALKAKLALLALGCWNMPITHDTPWGEFDLEHSPDICESVCILAKEGLMNASLGAILVANPDLNPAIKQLDKMGILNQHSLTILISQPHLASELKSSPTESALKFLVENCSQCLDQKMLIEFFTFNKKHPSALSRLISLETKRLPLPLITEGAKIIAQNNQSLPFYVLTQLTGKLQDKQAAAKEIINSRLQLCQSQVEVVQYLHQLKQIDYLYQRQGFDRFFSIHNYKYQGQKVSGVWLDIVKSFEARKNALAIEAAVTEKQTDRCLAR